MHHAFELHQRQTPKRIHGTVDALHGTSISHNYFNLDHSLQIESLDCFFISNTTTHPYHLDLHLD
jgi:hypothetical protein